MLSPNCLIQEFIVPVPTCGLTTGSRDLWSSLSRQELWVTGDRIAVVNPEELPIGVLYLHSLIPYLNSGEQFSERQSSILPHPHSAMVHALIQPIKIVPGNLSVREFWLHLNKLTTCNIHNEDWGVVNPEGKLLGLLDMNGLLQFLARHYQLQEIICQNNRRRHQPENPKNTSRISVYSGNEPESEVEPGQKTVEARDFLDPLAIAAIQQVISPLPFPVKAQTQEGQMIVENLAWRQELGNLSVGQVFPTTAAESIPSETELAEPLATRVSHLFSDSESEATLMCSLTNGSEQAWKFFKIPLEIDLSMFEILLPLGSQELWPAKYSNDSGEPSQSKKLRSPPEHPIPGVVPARESSSPTSHQAFAPLKSGMISRKLTLESHASDERASELTISQISSPEPERDSPSKSPLSLWLILAENVTEQQQVAQELVAKNADLVQLNRLKDEFLACISHELKTPLTAVLGLSTLLKDQALGPLNERQARYAKMIYQSGQHLMRVVNDILDLTRIETGQLQLNWEPVQITQVCEHALQQAQETQQMELAAGHHSVESFPKFTLEIEPGLNTIVTDHLRLRQMLYNLLSNALKFTPPEGEIGLKVNRWQGWIAFTVWDTGIGIPADKQHLIFQRFQQLENPLTRRFEGTGLGLVITQGLARSHGGDVTFISKEEKGSQFTILLPPSPPESGTIKKFPVRDQLLILIVEAAPQYVEELHEQLIRLGYRVAISRCGIDALEKARRLQPCVIFVNPLLPLLSGWDLLTLLKSDPQTGHIPVILTVTVVDKKRARKYRADGCLSLPLTASELQDQLRNLVPVELPEVQNIHTSKLTILRLTANVDSTNAALIQGLKIQSGKAYQILEADDLAQAELLAEIWQPQVILIEAAAALPEPRVFFQELSQSRLLGKLPIVTMDLATTEGANQVPGLIVFPCLVDAPMNPENTGDDESGILEHSVNMVPSASSYAQGSYAQGNYVPGNYAPGNYAQINYAQGNYAPGNYAPGNYADSHSDAGQNASAHWRMPSAQYLSQVLNLAAQIQKKPNILAIDISALPEFYQTRLNGLSFDRNSEEIEGEKFSSQLQHLLEIILALQSANLNAAIGRSWSEVWQLIQQQSLDLLLIYIPVDHLVEPMVNGLKAIANLAHKPQILIMYDRETLWHHHNSDFRGNSDSHQQPISREFLSFLQEIAKKVLPNSLSKEELLQEIQQILKSADSSQQPGGKHRLLK
jgi:signal transduction histidine kinase/DNA-binding response OmpR family regulator